MTPMPNFSLEGKSALITGAGRGIGRAIADVYAQAGAHVFLCARTRTEVEAAAAELTAAGYKAEARACDVTDVAAFRAMVEQLPRLDVFVNNAGVNRPKPQLEVTEEDFDAVVDLNLRGAFFALQSVTRKMVAEGGKASVINMSSQMGHIGCENRSLYCATKWALEGLTKSVAVELAPHNIRVNTICPTFIETALTKPYFENPEFLDFCMSKIKVGRLGQVDDITGAALYLASEASALMTGSAMMLDAGWTAD
ncbi:SDR family NAD(P)-dependent oxidoreductase [Xanthobacter sp. TB0139]|uniref:SDR family NAD(P)-dependent oxidoreductase n=1 Tax=Xanthobacter sp. TB0139 TaxID=3459178 RepID=UPI00403A061E